MAMKRAWQHIYRFAVDKWMNAASLVFVSPTKPFHLCWAVWETWEETYAFVCNEHTLQCNATKCKRVPHFEAHREEEGVKLIKINHRDFFFLHSVYPVRQTRQRSQNILIDPFFRVSLWSGAAKHRRQLFTQSCFTLPREVWRFIF